ncbi:alpha/beta hydrolase [Lacisediminihabitans sp.]|uniref:alpha/beta hydrolase n=1 Tax=Lacisediminihabitans sp. TaxID=2787631 RepID=UPI00374D5B86
MSATTSAVRVGLDGLSRVSPSLGGRASLFFFRRAFGRARVRESEAAVHRTAVVEHFREAGLDVVTYRWGSGERPVLLLHGWKSRSSRFALTVAALVERGYSPLSFDAPGHGDSAGSGSTVLDYQRVSQHLQRRYGPFESVIAHSFGVLAAFYAIGQGLRTKSLVALGGVSSFPFLVEEFARLTGIGPRAGMALRASISRHLFPHLDPWSSFDATRTTGSVDVPILVIHDEDDPTVPVVHSELLEAAFGPQLRAIRTRGLGHHLMSKEQLVPEILAFVRLHDHEEAR